MARKVKKAHKAVNPNRLPLVQGSSLTVGQANRQARQATRVRYGSAEHAQKQDIASNQTLGQDQAGWYDSYLKELATHGRTSTLRRSSRTRRCSSSGSPLRW
jgi:hypothetical protein